MKSLRILVLPLVVNALGACAPAGSSDSVQFEDIGTAIQAINHMWVYTIAAKYTNSCLDISTDQSVPTASTCKANAWNGGGAAASQRWQPVSNPSFPGVWQLFNPYSGKCLTSNASINSGAFTLGACTWDWDATHWYVSTVPGEPGANYYKIQSQHSGYCVASDAAGLLNKETCFDSWWSQRWEFLDNSETNNSPFPYVNTSCAALASGGPLEWIGTPCTPATGWTFWNSSETDGGDTGAYMPTGAIPTIYRGNRFNYGMAPNGDGTYTGQLAWDNYNTPANWPGLAYTDGQLPYIAFTDNYDVHASVLGSSVYPSLSQNLYLDIDVKLIDHARNTAIGGKLGRSRVTVTIMIEDSGNNNYLFNPEVELFHDPEYDRCPNNGPSHWGPYPVTPCDPGDRFSRRSAWGTGESVYISPNAASTAVPGVTYLVSLDDGAWHTYRIPIKKIFTSTTWQNAPTSYANLKLHGIMVGIESQYSVRTYIWAKNFRLYSDNH
jgi:hypothetical protein